MFGLWLLFGYYIYLEMVFAALCDFIWMSLNIYCILVVRYNFRNDMSIDRAQSEVLISTALTNYYALSTVHLF